MVAAGVGFWCSRMGTKIDKKTEQAIPRASERMDGNRFQCQPDFPLLAHRIRINGSSVLAKTKAEN